MATKKLKVELELETAKAKKKLDDMADTGGGGPSGPSPVDDAARKTAREIKSLGEETGKCQVNMRGAVKAFAGMGVGMAMNYAANYLPQGSTTRNAVEYGAGAIQGASMGMMFGPLGAALGAAGGLAKTYLDKQGEQKQYTKDWQKSEHDYANNKAFADFMSSLTKVGDGALTHAEKLKRAQDELDRYREVEKKQVEDIGKMIKSGRYDDATAQRGYLAVNRARQDALENYIQSMEDKKNDGVRASMSSVDALSRLDGDFTGGGGRGDDLVRIAREEVDILKSIDRKTGGGLVWQ